MKGGTSQSPKLSPSEHRQPIGPSQLDGVADDDIVELNIPTARPLVHELDDRLRPIRHYYLGHQDTIHAAMQAVADQGKAT